MDEKEAEAPPVMGTIFLDMSVCRMSVVCLSYVCRMSVVCLSDVKLTA